MFTLHHMFCAKLNMNICTYLVYIYGQGNSATNVRIICIILQLDRTFGDKNKVVLRNALLCSANEVRTYLYTKDEY